jgi:methylthioxylose transferase
MTDVQRVEVPAAAPSSPLAGRVSWLAVGVAAVLVAGCAATGWWLTRHGAHLHQGTAYPLDGHYRLHFSPWLLAPVALGWAIIHYGPSWSGRLAWRRLLGLSWLTAAGWALALAVVAGPAAIAAPLTTIYEYPHDVPRISELGIGAFLHTYTAHVVDAPVWTVHVAGHPPLATLVFVLLAEAGLPQAGWAATLCVLAGASAAASVLSTTRLLAGEARARAAAPFVVAAPLALWVATSADALFAGAAAAGICALAHAAARRDRRGDALALVGGLILGGCLFLSYGLVLMAPLALTVVVVRRRLRPLLVAGAAAALVVAAFAVAGFWWLDGLALTTGRMFDGAAHSERPLVYFLFANFAALAIAVGPAVVAGLPHAWRARRHRRTVALPAAALLALVVATVSDLSRGEVERIWLPWAVWLPPLAAALPAVASCAAGRRAWLAAQLGWALLIAATTELTW